MRLDLRGNPGGVVPDLDYHTSGVAIYAHPKFPPAVDGVDRVIDDVGPNLIQLTAERIHEKRDRLVITLDLHSAFELVVQNRQGAFQALYNINVLLRRLVHEGVFLNGAYQ